MSSKWFLYAIVLYFVESGHCEGTSLITLSSDTVYQGELVTVMCHRSAGILLSLTIDAFNATSHQGILYCNVHPVNVTATGVFSGKSITGCPDSQAGSLSASVSFLAIPSMELSYNCTSTIYNRPDEYTQVSGTVSLSVLLLPERPIFVNTPLVFNENDKATIVCESRSGKPAAVLSFTVRVPSGKEVSTTGIDSALLMLPVPLTDWHNASAVCTVTNHNFSSNTVSSGITVHHIFRTIDHVIVPMDSSNTTLDCSAYVHSYPRPQYSWSSRRSTSTVYYSFDSSPSLTVFRNESGSFYCTATNNATGSSVTIEFTAYASRPLSLDWRWIALCVAILVIFVITIVIVILRTRGCFSTGCFNVCSKLQTSPKSGNTRDNGEEIAMTENPVYDSLPASVADVGEESEPNCIRCPTRCEGASDGDGEQCTDDHLSLQNRHQLSHIYEEIEPKTYRAQSQTPKNEDIKLLSTAADVT